MFVVQIHLDELVIIESLRPSDFPTAQDLSKQLQRGSTFPIPVSLQKVDTRVDLLRTLASIAQRAEAGGWIPLLHFEMHGNEDLLATRTGPSLRWWG